MTKRFIFLLVLVLVLIASTLTALAGNEVPGVELSLVAEEKIPPTITTPGGIAYYEEKHADVFFNPDNTSEEDFLVTLSARRDPRSPDPLRHLITGSVLRPLNDQPITAEDTVMLLLYIKRDGAFEPLTTIDNKLFPDTNLAASPTLFYTKVQLDNLGNDQVNELRVVAFRQKDADRLVLGETLQITDMKVVARVTGFERLRIFAGDLQNIVTDTAR